MELMEVRMYHVKASPQEVLARIRALAASGLLEYEQLSPDVVRVMSVVSQGGTTSMHVTVRADSLTNPRESFVSIEGGYTVPRGAPRMTAPILRSTLHNSIRLVEKLMRRELNMKFVQEVQ
jgi:hypothetical protein